MAHSILAIAACLATGTGGLFAQKKAAPGEQTLEQRLMSPDPHRQQPIELRQFQGTSGLEMKGFQGSKAFQSRAFSDAQKVETPRFLGIPIP